MKRITLFLAAAVAALSLTSCEAMLDALSNSLTFVFAGTTIYDGQTALLGVTYDKDVAWSVDAESAKIIELTYDENGKNCIAKVKLPTGTTTSKVVKVTNYDKYDSSVDKNTGEITVAPWRLEIFKANGKKDEKGNDLFDNLMETENCTYNPALNLTEVNLKKTGTGTYKVKMYGLNEKGEWAAIAPIHSLNLFNHPEHRVYWEGTTAVTSTVTTSDSDVAEGVYEKLVVFESLPTTNQGIKVYLGKDRDEKGNVKNPKTYDKNVVVKGAQFMVK